MEEQTEEKEKYHFEANQRLQTELTAQLADVKQELEEHETKCTFEHLEELAAQWEVQKKMEEKAEENEKNHHEANQGLQVKLAAERAIRTKAEADAKQELQELKTEKLATKYEAVMRLGLENKSHEDTTKKLKTTLAELAKEHVANELLQAELADERTKSKQELETHKAECTFEHLEELAAGREGLKEK